MRFPFAHLDNSQLNFGVRRPLAGARSRATWWVYLVGITGGYNWTYTWGVKTAISLPDDLFTAAEALAGRLGLSRSQLYATALTRFVAEQERATVTARLDAVYAQAPDDAAERAWAARAVAHTLRATAPEPDGW